MPGAGPELGREQREVVPVVSRLLPYSLHPPLGWTEVCPLLADLNHSVLVPALF